MIKESLLYRVIFLQEEKVYEIYARNLTEETLVGFIEAEELVFNENTQVVVDPSEELLKKEFTGVKRTYIPQHLILRIDEVTAKGSSTIKTGAKAGMFGTFHKMDVSETIDDSANYQHRRPSAQ